MKTEELTLSSVISASPNQIYAALLDERQHTAFIGARATVEPWVGGRLTAWDAYATALIAGLDTGKRILLSWRTADFPPSVPDSHVEIRLESTAGGTKVEIRQKGIPAGQAAQYKEAWKKHYLDTMRKMFAKPEALRNAIREASKAGRLPIPGVTAARPGTVRPFTVRDPNAVPVAAVTGGRSRDDDDDDDESEDREERYRRYSGGNDYDDDRPMRRAMDPDDMPKRPSKPVPLPGAMTRAAEAAGAKGKRGAKEAAKAPAPPKTVPKGTVKPAGKAAVKPAPKVKALPAKAAQKPAAKPSKSAAKALAKKPSKKASAKPVKAQFSKTKAAKKKAAPKPSAKRPVKSPAKRPVQAKRANTVASKKSGSMKKSAASKKPANKKPLAKKKPAAKK